MTSAICNRQTRMRITISEFISLDGVVQAPGGAEEDTDGGFRHGGWSMPFFDPEVMGAAIDEVAKRTEALLYGRRTFEVMAGAWPDRAGDPFADWINGADKYVVSDSLAEGDITWNPTTIIRGKDLVPAIEALRAKPGGEVNVWGSATLARTLLANDLVDELNLMIEPIVLGGGKSIWSDDGIARTMKLVSATTAGTGVQVCRYERVR
jgi:dihydrofolate reductase